MFCHNVFTTLTRLSARDIIQNTATPRIAGTTCEYRGRKGWQAGGRHQNRRASPRLPFFESDSDQPQLQMHRKARSTAMAPEYGFVCQPFMLDTGSDPPQHSFCRPSPVGCWMTHVFPRFSALLYYQSPLYEGLHVSVLL